MSALLSHDCARWRTEMSALLSHDCARWRTEMSALLSHDCARWRTEMSALLSHDCARWRTRMSKASLGFEPALRTFQMNPKGIPPQSPRLRAASYPGKSGWCRPTLNGEWHLLKLILPYKTPQKPNDSRTRWPYVSAIPLNGLHRLCPLG